MLFRMVAVLVLLAGCAEEPLPPPLHYPAPKRTLRIIGTEHDMTLGGEQYCRGPYSLEFTSWDHTEGLITCE